MPKPDLTTEFVD